jgi:hypothetical protein
MQKKLLILFLLLAFSLSISQSVVEDKFIIEKVDVKISNINPDGSVRVHESIKLAMFGDYSISLYDSAVSKSELSLWSNVTGLSDVKFHINPSKVAIREFRLRPQPRTRCNPIQGICHGELILDYLALPSFTNNSSSPVSGTGIFSTYEIKPRTMRYVLNPNSLSFTSTSDGNLILSDSVFLTIAFPDSAELVDLNPAPVDSNIEVPSQVDELTWNDMALVRFSLVFDVEDSIDQEIVHFFSKFFENVLRFSTGTNGKATMTESSFV